MMFFHTTPSARRRALFCSRRNRVHTKQGSRVISFRSDILHQTRLVQLEDSREGVKVHGRLNLDTAAGRKRTATWRRASSGLWAWLRVGGARLRGCCARDQARGDPRSIACDLSGEPRGTASRAKTAPPKLCRSISQREMGFRFQNPIPFTNRWIGVLRPQYRNFPFDRQWPSAYLLV